MASHYRRLPLPAPGSALTVLLLLVAPWPRQWLVQARPHAFIYHEYTDFILYLSDGAAALLALAGLWRWRQKENRVWGPAAISLPLALLAGRAFLTGFAAVDQPLAFLFAARLGLLWLLYLGLLALRPGKGTVVAGLSAGILLQSSIALGQFLRGREVGLSALGEIPLAGILGPALAGRAWLRAPGLTPHPNLLGGFLAVYWLALLPCWWQAAGRRRLWWGLLLAYGLVGLAIPFSRSAWLGGLAGGLFFLAAVTGSRTGRRPGSRRIWLALLATGLLLLLASPATFLARGLDTSSLAGRAALAGASLELLGARLWSGVGAGSFPQAILPYLGQRWLALPEPVHNLPLLVTAELGLAGGLVWAWLMLAPLVIAWRGLRQGKLTPWAAGLTAGLLALAVIDLFDFYSWGWPQGRLLRWSWLALWVNSLQPEAPGSLDR